MAPSALTHLCCCAPHQIAVPPKMSSDHKELVQLLNACATQARTHSAQRIPP
jgi:hypothetical protein